MSKKKAPSFRSPLGRVRALGSAKSGTHHWYMLRVAAVALLLLVMYPIFGFFIYAVYGGRAGALEWLNSPVAATGVVLFLIAGFYHATHGLKEVIEDYIHCECAKTAILVAIKLGAFAFAVLGILATLKIMLGV